MSNSSKRKKNKPYWGSSKSLSDTAISVDEQRSGLTSTLSSPMLSKTLSYRRQSNGIEELPIHNNGQQTKMGTKPVSNDQSQRHNQNSDITSTNAITTNNVNADTDQNKKTNKPDTGSLPDHNNNNHRPNESNVNLPLLAEQTSERGESVDELSKSDSNLSADHMGRPEYITLPQDSFSFIIANSFLSVPSILGILTFAIKVAIWSLMIGNITSFGDNITNIFGIPAAVSSAVVIAQLISIIIVSLTQEDFLTCLSQVYEGYSEDSIKAAFPQATRFKWLLVLFMTFFAGICGLVVTFILMITSDDVIELLLNFTAVEFVAFLDNSAFALALRGFLGTHNLQAAHQVMETQFPRRAKYGTTRIYELAIFSLVFFSMVGGWAFVYTKQVAGDFAKSTIYVQFGDDNNLGVGAYSGVYKLRSLSRFSIGGISYEYQEDQGSAVFSYCSSNEMWTFRLSGSDPCQNVLARSSETTSSQITTTSSEWSILSKASPTRFHPMQSFYLTAGCVSDDDCGGTDRGYCTDNQCVCKDNFYGLRCDYVLETTCSQLVVDELGDSFISGSRTFSNTFDILRDDEENLVLIYHHPVYFYLVDEGIELIFYSGLRWVLLLAAEDRGLVGLTNFTRSGLVEYLQDTTVAIRDRLISVELVSLPIFFDTPSDDAPTPLGVYWFLARNGFKTGEVSGSSQAMFICGICSAFSQCLYGGVCLSTGDCECANGATGTLCQIPPVGDGHCDVFFNEAVYDYDNGDCCQSTCESSSKYECGIEAFGKLERIKVGFPYCKDPAINCGEHCWTEISQPATLLSRTGTWPRIQLSSNGRILILSEPELDALQVFDLRGSEWVQRGPILSGPRSSNFGLYLDLASLPGTVVSQRIGLMPIALAVGVERSSGYGIQVFRFEQNDIDWRNVGDEIEACSLSQSKNCQILSVSIGQDRDHLVVAVVMMDAVKVFETYLEANEDEIWQPVDLVGATNYTASTVSLAQDGKVCAIASGVVPGEIAIHRFYEDPTFLHLSVLLERDIVEILTLELDYHGETLSTHFLHDQNGILQDAFATVHTSEEEQNPMIIDWIEETVIDAKFSEDGNTVAIKMDTDEGALIRIVDYSLKAVDFNDHNLALADYSLSYDGSFLGVSNQDGGRVFEGTGVRCKNQTLVSISIVMDERPEEVSWDLEAIRVANGNVTTTANVGRCANCYYDIDRYSRTNIVEDRCYPSDCLRFRYHAPHGHRGGAGFVMFVNGRHVFTFDDGSQEEQIVYLNGNFLDDCVEEWS